jgi:hypothetical protein
LAKISQLYRKQFFSLQPIYIFSENKKKPIKMSLIGLTPGKNPIKLSRREICAANFLPPCEKAPPTFNQKLEFRVTLKKGYLLQGYRSRRKTSYWLLKLFN